MEGISHEVCFLAGTKGAPNKQGGHNVHGELLGVDEIAAACGAMGWTLPPFEVPDANLCGLGRQSKRGGLE